ncbi:MAG: phage major capsid protein [Clostridia bacterium]|nr:phage major capsid protein [Clostridia bacterium]
MNYSNNYDDLMARLNAIMGMDSPEKKETERAYATYKNAFWENMRTGVPQNALKESVSSSGGYLVPDSFEERIITKLEEDNILRKVSRVIKTTRDLKIPIVLKKGGTTWVKEGELYFEDNEEFGEALISAYKLAQLTLASDELLEDSAFDLEQYILDAAVDNISSAEEEAFIKGDGIKKPLGIIHQASVGAVTSDSNIIDVDDMINLKYSLSEPYRHNAVWLVSSDVYIALSKIRHYKGHRFMDLSEDGETEMLLGQPVYVCKSLDNIALGSKSAIFGDFSHFWIGDRGRRSIKRLSEKYADSGQVGFIVSERVDAKLVVPEAVKVLQTKAE